MRKLTRGVVTSRGRWNVARHSVLTLSEISDLTGISMPTLSKYKADEGHAEGRLARYVVGSGRKAKFKRGAVPVFLKLRNEGLGKRGHRKSVSVLLLVVWLLFGGASAHAELVRAKASCGPPIKRSQVTVLDVSELTSADAAAFVDERVGGPLDVVKRETVVAGSVFAGAWRDAEKRAARMGCPFVVITKSRRQQTGTMPSDIFDARSQRVPVYKNAVEAEYAMRVQESAEPARTESETAVGEKVKRSNTAEKTKDETPPPSPLRRLG